MTAWPLQRDCADFYGNPATAKGNASPKWEKENLVLIKCPWVLRYDGKPVRGIRIHKKCADSLSRVLARIWERAGKSQAVIDRMGMSVYGGSYNFRPVRGGASLSMHAYGCAVDFDPARNGLGNPNPAMSRVVIEEFEREGWEWGGHWSRPDGMHFQAAWTRASPPRLKAAPSYEPAKPAEPDAAEPMPAIVHRTEIERLQSTLKALGYHEVGMIDGDWGPRTRAALLAFKADNHLPLTPDLDETTWAALSKALPRVVSVERQTATDAPSEAAKAAKAAKKVGIGVVGISALETLLSPIGGMSGLAEWISGIGNVASSLRTAFEPIRDLLGLVASNWIIFAILLGIGLIYVGHRVFRDELESYRRGEWS